MRNLMAAILFSGLPAYPSAQGFDPDKQLTENPKAHLELPRKVTDMTCINTGFTAFICYKDVAGAVLSVEAPTIAPSPPPSFVKAFKRACQTSADMEKTACLATVSFQATSVEVDRLGLEAGGPLVRRVAFKAAAIEIRPPN